MKNILKQNISSIWKDIKSTFKQRNYSKLLDYLVIMIFISIALFIPVYKIATNLEKIFFNTHYLLLSNSTKSQLPQLAAYTLVLISFIKWILASKTGDPKIKTTKEDKKGIQSSISLSFRKKTYLIPKSAIYTICLLFILTFFFIRKIPYWGISFTINHPLKYNTYVDPALSMFKRNDPFFIQRKYMHNPITDSRGIGTQYGNLPLLEWMLFIGYKIFWNILPMEVITRMVMIMIGCVALLSFYLFTKKVFSEKLALMGTFLLSINAIFNLSSFVTVYDIINFVLTFFSFSLLIDSLEQNNSKKMFFAGLLIGIGASIKINILLWSLPFVLICIMYTYRRNIKFSISRIILFLFGLTIPYIIVKTTVNFFPTKNLKYFIGFFISLAILIFLIKYIERIASFINKISSKCIDFISKHKFFILFIPLIVGIGIKLVYSTTVSEEFLTDWTLLFNTNLYVRLLTEQLVPYTGWIPFILLILAIPLFIYYCKDKKENLIISAFTLASLFYLIIASKALFFHSYYWLFIIASLTILITWGIIFIGEKFFSRIAGIAYIISLATSLFFCLSGFVDAKLDREYPRVNDLIKYINTQDFEDGTSFIDQANLSYLTMKTDLYRVYDNAIVFKSPKFKTSVQKIGFTETMGKYKIRYLITSDTGPDYTIFTEAFSKSTITEGTTSKRTSLILDSLYNTNTSCEEPILPAILVENHIEDQFKLIKDFGPLKLYKLVDACFTTIIK